MDAINAAIIAAIASIIAAAIPIAWQMKLLRRSRAQLQLANADFWSALVAKYGLCMRTVTSSFHLLDLEGNAKISRKFEGVAAGEGARFESIPGRCWASVGRAGSRVHDPKFTPILENFRKAVTCVTKISPGETVLDFHVKIANNLTKKDGPFGYIVEFGIEKAALVTEEEVREAYRDDEIKFEFHGFDVHFPTEELVIEITFPDAYSVKPFPTALYGFTEVRHDLEFDRVNEIGIKTEGQKHSLRVPHPLPGFRYAIYWQSPKRADILHLLSKGENTKST